MRLPHVPCAFALLLSRGVAFVTSPRAASCTAAPGVQHQRWPSGYQSKPLARFAMASVGNRHRRRSARLQLKEAIADEDDALPMEIQVRPHLYNAVSMVTQKQINSSVCYAKVELSRTLESQPPIDSTTRCAMLPYKLGANFVCVA